MGCLQVPRSLDTLGTIQNYSVPWAADNGAFTNFCRSKYISMLDRLKEYPPGMWVTAPDVVEDHWSTCCLFESWEPYLRERGFPVAFVAQDGATIDTIPWKRMECLFIGGSDSFKLGLQAFRLIEAAKVRKKLVHMGRVNSLRRLRYAWASGCDSVDGSSFTMYPNVHLYRALRALEKWGECPVWKS